MPWRSAAPVPPSSGPRASDASCFPIFSHSHDEALVWLFLRITGSPQVSRLLRKNILTDPMAGFLHLLLGSCPSYVLQGSGGNVREGKPAHVWVSSCRGDLMRARMRGSFL